MALSERHNVLLAALFVLAGPVLLLTLALGGAVFQYFTALSAELARVLEIFLALLALLAVGGTLMLLFLASAKVWRVYTTPSITEDEHYVILHNGRRLVVLEKRDTASSLMPVEVLPSWTSPPSLSPAPAALPPLAALLKPGYSEEEVLDIARAAQEEMARQALD